MNRIRNGNNRTTLTPLRLGLLRNQCNGWYRALGASILLVVETRSQTMLPVACHARELLYMDGTWIRLGEKAMNPQCEFEELEGTYARAPSRLDAERNRKMVYVIGLNFMLIDRIQLGK